MVCLFFQVSQVSKGIPSLATTLVGFVYVHIYLYNFN